MELHPGFMCYNPTTLLRLREAVGDGIGANLDPSHLFWQGIDICEAIKLLGKAGAISIEHEDGLMSPLEGLEKAIEFLKPMIIKESAGAMWWA